MINKSLKLRILKLKRDDIFYLNLLQKRPTDKILYKKYQGILKRHTKEAEKIIGRYGWPNFDLVGKQASHAFWLIVQHADFNLNFQKRSLKLLSEAVRQEQARPKDFAYLTDRILVAQGKKQKFGTQFVFSPEKNEFVLKPIAGLKNINVLRTKYGLMPLEKEQENINKNFSKKLKNTIKNYPGNKAEN